MEINLNQIVDCISNMKVSDIVLLIDMIEKKFNVSCNDISLNKNSSLENSEKKEEKNSFSLFLNKIGNNKLSVIKLLRSKNSNIGLKEAKDLVESCPVKLFDNLSKEEVKLYEKEFIEIGSEIEIK